MLPLEDIANVRIRRERVFHDFMLFWFMVMTSPFRFRYPFELCRLLSWARVGEGDGEESRVTSSNTILTTLGFLATGSYKGAI